MRHLESRRDKVKNAHTPAGAVGIVANALTCVNTRTRWGGSELGSMPAADEVNEPATSTLEERLNWHA